MLVRLLLVTALLFALSPPQAVLAQPAGRAGDVSRPSSPITAPYTAPTGRVVPRPGSFDPAATRGIEKRTPQQDEDNAIMRRICTGCT